MAIADDRVAVLHLRSSLPVFSAGADLALIQACFATPEGPDAMTDVVRAMQRLYARLEAAPLLTLAEIGATALGGGLELALACDLRVAARDVHLGLPEAGLGLLPGAGGTQRLTRLCGPGVAKRLILGAEVIDGAQARELGIVQWALPKDQLAAWTRALATRLAGAPKAALAANKRCIALPLTPQATDTPWRSPKRARSTTTRRHASWWSHSCPGERAARPLRGTMMNARTQIAVVTGAASGIGRACARVLARSGAHVVVADIDSVNGAEVAKRCATRVTKRTSWRST